MNKNKTLVESLDIVIAQCFKRYSKYIIQDRALPDIRDGLKPVQRRILYAMNELGLTYDKQYKKSARTVGEVIGKYHPHGDSSIYEAMVRMSQDWKNNIPLLDMHGNNGSIDGDSAAAMRYTETKLSKVSNLMLENIKKETVSFAFNFDDTEKEPTVLPSLLPNLLINGAMGIAAGYATNIPTHNPSEVFKSIIYRISNPKCTLDEIMQILPAPDFPTGGIIQGIDGVKESFKTGKGKFIISCKYEFNLSNSKFNQIIITEIPYDTNKSQIIKELLEIMYNEKVSGILDIRDESDKNGVSIVIDIKKDRDLEQIMNYFLKNSQLQINYTTNFIAIVDRKPMLVPLLFALDCYIKFGIEIILKTAIFDLAKTEKRAEIVQGLIKAIDIIDEIIKIIRKSESKEDAKNNLIARFDFTPIQAEAIVTLRLYRLTKTDINDLKFEYEELTNQIKFLKSLIDSEALQRKYLKKELESFDKEFGYPRKTQIQDEIKKLDFNEQAIIESKDVYVFVSNDGYLKQISKKAFDANTLAEIGLKPFDNIIYFNVGNTKQNLILISKFGKSVFLPIHKIKNIKWKDIGQHINELVTLESNDKIVFASIFEQIDKTSQLIMLTKNGLVKKISLIEALNTKQLKPNLILKLKENDEIVDCNLINENENYFISTLTKCGYGMTFSTAEISLKSRTSTAIPGFKLQKNDECINLAISKTLQPILLLNTKNEFKKISLDELTIKKRNQTMVKILKTNDIKSFVILNQNSNENIFVFNDGKVDFINVSEIELNNTKTIFVKSKKFTNMSCIKIDSLVHEQIVENLQKSKYEIYVPSSDEEKNISLDELMGDENENN